MLRSFIEELGLFAIPFLAFAAYLLLSRRSPLDRVHWDPHWVRLILAGVFVVVTSLVMTGLTASRYPDGYVPPHMENGRLVPGRFE